MLVHFELSFLLFPSLWFLIFVPFSHFPNLLKTSLHPSLKDLQSRDKSSKTNPKLRKQNFPSTFTYSARQ
jgi:hypothetical protein